MKSRNTNIQTFIETYAFWANSSRFAYFSPEDGPIKKNINRLWQSTINTHSISNKNQARRCFLRRDLSGKQKYERRKKPLLIKDIFADIRENHQKKSRL